MSLLRRLYVACTMALFGHSDLAAKMARNLCLSQVLRTSYSQRIRHGQARGSGQPLSRVVRQTMTVDVIVTSHAMTRFRQRVSDDATIRTVQDAFAAATLLPKDRLLWPPALAAVPTKPGLEYYYDKASDRLFPVEHVTASGKLLPGEPLTRMRIVTIYTPVAQVPTHFQPLSVSEFKQHFAQLKKQREKLMAGLQGYRRGSSERTELQQEIEQLDAQVRQLRAGR